MHAVKRYGIEQMGTEVSEICSVEEGSRGDRDELPADPQGGGREDEKCRIQIRCVETGGSHRGAVQTRHSQLAVGGILDHEVELSFQIEGCIQSRRIEDEVGFQGRCGDSTHPCPLAFVECCPQMRKHGWIALNGHDFQRQLRLLRQHPIHEGSREYARASSGIENAKRAVGWKARKGGDQLSRLRGGEELSQVRLSTRIKLTEGGNTLDLGDAQEVCRQHPLTLSGAGSVAHSGCRHRPGMPEAAVPPSDIGQDRGPSELTPGRRPASRPHHPGCAGPSPRRRASAPPRSGW